MTLLRNGPKTVNDLADALKMTDNGVKAHLAALQAQNLVNLAGQRAGSRKPHQLFSLTPAGHLQFPTAEGPLLNYILAGLEGTMSTDALTVFLKQTGGQMAEPYRADFTGASAEKRLQLALKILGKIGGVADASQHHGMTTIQGRHCPLANLVTDHPEVCAVAQGLLERLLDRPVLEKCEKGRQPCCRFELSAA